MKKILISIIAVAIFFACYTDSAYALELTAKSAILIDAASGKILFNQNSHEKLPVASTTKVLTGMLVLENVSDLHKTITIPEDFVNVGESGIYLAAGETLTYEDLLYAMLLCSANDAAQVLAVGVSGSEKDFVELMNQRTAELGLTDSHWANPHGLDAAEHYSSAYDLAMIARAAAQIPEYNTIVSTYTWTIPWKSNEYDRVVYNHNQFLSSYEGADGMKTGYTSKSGNCLIASATKNGMRLISVILNSTDHYGETTQLMNYGFDNYSLSKVANKGKIVGSVKVVDGRDNAVDVVLGDDVYLVMKNDSRYSPDAVVNLPPSIKTPFDSDHTIGTIAYRDGDGNTVEFE
ncbi:MAG: D-alanyl-D-alanine carboxypeptidase family protein, partial [Clostridiales bacterium]